MAIKMRNALSVVKTKCNNGSKIITKTKADEEGYQRLISYGRKTPMNRIGIDQVLITTFKSGGKEICLYRNSKNITPEKSLIYHGTNMDVIRSFIDTLKELASNGIKLS